MSPLAGTGVAVASFFSLDVCFLPDKLLQHVRMNEAKALATATYYYRVCKLCQL
jgi:hypothetical protein